MKRTFTTGLILLFGLSFSFGLNPDKLAKWIITAKISRQASFHEDSLTLFAIGGMSLERIYQSSGNTNASATITVILENQADNPEKEFVFDSSSGDETSISVSGSGLRTETSRYQETIDGKVVEGDNRFDNASGSASKEGASVQFFYTEDSKSFSVIADIGCKASYSGKLFRDGGWQEYGGDYDYNINCAGGGELNSGNCKITKTGKGFQASCRISEHGKEKNTINGTIHFSNEITVELTIAPYIEPDKAIVALNGCASLGVGETEVVTATANPEGGSFKFWAEPSGLVSVSANGASATLTGQTPGRGALMVEYTSPGGKTAQSSMEASCVEVVAYNGGAKIPRFVFYDVDGNKLETTKKFALQVNPGGASDLLKFVPADPGVISVTGLGSEIAIQAVIQGKTTFQGKTNCDQETGPTVDVEVVYCDEETIATLERMRKVASDNLADATKKLQQEAGSEAFEKARDELVGSTIELLAKAGLTIIANGKTSGAVKVAAEIADKGSALSDMIASSNPEELKNNIGKTATGESFEKIVETRFGEAVGELWGKSASAAIGVLEVQQAAQKFGDVAGEILKHEGVMKSYHDNFEQAYKNLTRIMDRLKLCKGPEQAQRQTQAKPGQTPKPQDKTQANGAEPKSGQPTNQPPQTTEPSSPEPGDEIFIDPEPPKFPPKMVGLPYEPSSGCGCENAKELTAKSSDYETLGAGIKNLGNCVDSFVKTSLNDYNLALQEISSISGSLSEAMKTDASDFFVKAKGAKPRLDELVARVKSYDKAGSDFLGKMSKCPASVTAGMEIFGTVEKITIDSVKTNY